MSAQPLTLPTMKLHVPPPDDMQESQRIGSLNELTSIRLSVTAPRNPDYNMHVANKLLGQNAGFDTPPGLCWLAAAIQLIHSGSDMILPLTVLSAKANARFRELHRHLTEVCSLLKVCEKPLESSYLLNVQRCSGCSGNGPRDVTEVFMRNAILFSYTIIQVPEIPQFEFQPEQFHNRLAQNHRPSATVIFCFNRGSPSGTKNCRKFGFPEAFESQNVRYELSCIIEHEGDECTDGHWVSWVKLNPTIQSTDHFYAKVDGSEWDRPVKLLPHKDTFLGEGDLGLVHQAREECEGLVNREASLLCYVSTSASQTATA